MNKPRSSSGRTNLASCILATIFLIFVAIIILIIFFTVFKPKDPKIAVNSIQLPAFSLANGTVNFTFSQYVSLRNPNRAVFSHYDSTLQLFYGGNRIGFMFIPAGKINAGQTVYMSATFSVDAFPFAGISPSVVGGYRYESMEIESRLKIVGRVRVLHVFTHHAEAKSGCVVDIAVRDGSVLGFHC
ncbi:uncharacterized protein [Aristolochia californica]|uniref:uncharacterized protein n=1 Tax=Aristolochia californica TaxID=171875 RepID=UPI0035DCC57E